LPWQFWFIWSSGDLGAGILMLWRQAWLLIIGAVAFVVAFGAGLHAALTSRLANISLRRNGKPSLHHAIICDELNPSPPSSPQHTDA